MRVVVVAPPQPVITLEEAQVHLRVDGNDEDDLIEALVAAATAHIDGPDGWLGRAIGMQTLEARGPLFGCAPIRLPYPPVASIVSVKYDDDAGMEQTLDASAYALQGDRLAAEWGSSWPRPRGSAEPVRVQYQAGYGVIPAPIRAAILLMVGDLWLFRATAVTGTIASSIPMSTTVERLLQPFRIYT